MDYPRPKHQTQALYTAPRLSERLERASPLNNRRITTDLFHDNKTLSSQSSRLINKSHRRHSTNAYSTSQSPNVGHKELSPSNSLNTSVASNYYENVKNMAKDGVSGVSNSLNSNQRYMGKKMVKRKKTTSHFDGSNMNSNSGNGNNGSSNNTNAINKGTKQQTTNTNSNSNSNTGSNSNNQMGKTIKMSAASSR